MKLYKRGTKWYADLRKEGKGRVSLGTEDKKLAREMARRLVDGGKTGKTIGDAVDLAMGTHYMGTKNWRMNKSIGDELKEDLGSLKLDRFTGRQLQLYVNNRRKAGNKDATISRKVSMLIVCFRIAIGEGWCDRIPERPILKGSRVRHRELTLEEFELLKFHSEPWARDLWSFLVETGCRVSEALNLNRQAQAQALGRNEVTFRDTKNGKDRTVPLTKQAHRALWSGLWLGKTPRQVSFAWEQARYAMGLREDKDFVTHCLRHTCASKLVQGGVSLELVGKWLGHSSVKVTERYAHLRTEDLAQGVRVLEGED